MAKLIEYRGTYGGGNPCMVFVYETRGGAWYAVQDSLNVNFTHDEITEGVDVETLTDSDMFTASQPINSTEILEAEVDD